MRRTAALGCALVVALTAAPAQAVEEPQPPLPPAGSGAPPMLDPPGEALLEPPFNNRGQELMRRAGATNSLCRTLEQLDELKEPRPDRVKEIQLWVSRYYANLQLFDPSGKVTDPDSGDDVDVPKELVQTVDMERRAIFAFQQRVSYANLLVDQEQVPAEELQLRLDHAFVALANSDYDIAHRRLLAAGRRYC